MKNKTDRCIICGSTNLKDRRSLNDSIITTCQDCGFGLLTTFPIEKKNLYSGTENSIAKGNVENEILIHKNNPKIQEKIINYFRFTPIKRNRNTLQVLNDKTSVIYDLGCGAGIFLAILENKKYQNLFGIEYNADSVDLIKANFGFQIRCSEIKHQKDWPLADLITSVDVLEHLPDVNKSMIEINKIAKPNSYVYIRVPNYGSFFAKLLKSKWIWEIPPYHINYFTKKSLKIIFEKNGFEVIENYTKSSGFRFVFLLIQFFKIFNNKPDIETVKSGKINMFKLFISRIIELFVTIFLFPLILLFKIKDIDDCIYLIVKKIKS